MNVIDKMAALPSNTALVRAEMDMTFVVRNTKEGHFRFSRGDLVSMFRAIEANIDLFARAGCYYQQDRWRELVSVYFKGIAKTSAGNQTRLTFNLLAMAIRAVCLPGTDHQDGYMPLSLANVRETIAALEGEPVCEDGQRAEIEEDVTGRVKGGCNILLTGAPGTGKSHMAKAMAEAGDKAFFTSFSKDTENTDFFGNVGTQVGADGGTEFVFEPGIFLLALAHAMKNPREKVTLVIDEINRGNATAIFGPLFVMMDREESGEGTYPAALGNNKMRRWLEQETETDCSEIRIPSNLSLIATMNGSDRSVGKVDTALHRRFEAEPVSLKYELAPDATISIPTGRGKRLEVSYRRLLRCLNDFIMDHMHQGEDGRIGPFFIPRNRVVDGADIPSSIITYVWGLRDKSRGATVFRDRIKTRDDIESARLNGTAYLSPDFLRSLEGVDEAQADDD